jgi:hypothetical protein
VEKTKSHPSNNSKKLTNPNGGFRISPAVLSRRVDNPPLVYGCLQKRVKPADFPTTLVLLNGPMLLQASNI